MCQKYDNVLGENIMSKKKQNIRDEASGLRNLSHTKPIQVIAVSAGKGVGKSNIAVNLAVGLAQLNKK